jgi:hypothetical protein
MRTRIPYLAGLARQTAGQLPLRPPHRLFASDVYAPMRSPDQRASRSHTGDAAGGGVPGAVWASHVVDEPPWRATSPRGADAAPDPLPTAAPWPTPAALAPDVPATPAAPAASAAQVGSASTSARGAATARAERRGASPGPPAGPDLAESATDLPPRLLAPPTVLAPPHGAKDVTPRTATDPTLPKSSPTVPDPLRVSPPNPAWTEQPPGAAAPGAAPVAVTPPTRRDGGVPPWSDQPDAPADVPHAWPSEFEFWGMPVELPKPYGPAAGVQADPPGDHTARPGIEHARAGDAPSRAAIRELLPGTTPAIEQPGGRAGGSQDGGAAPRARVSIGTIEVTVVPPAAPTPAVGAVRPPAQTAPSRSRAGSALALSPGSDRLRDGLRRWYGIAQG